MKKVNHAKKVYNRRRTQYHQRARLKSRMSLTKNHAEYESLKAIYNRI